MNDLMKTKTPRNAHMNIVGESLNKVDINSLSKFDAMDIESIGKVSYPRKDINIEKLSSNIIQVLKKDGLGEIRDSNNSLEKLLEKLNFQTFGEYICNDSLEQCAYGIYEIIKQHPFKDGNKRAGGLCLYFLLKEQGLSLPHDTYITLAPMIACSHTERKTEVFDTIKRLIVLYNER